MNIIEMVECENRRDEIVEADLGRNQRVCLPKSGVLFVIFKPYPSKPALLEGLFVNRFILVIPKFLKIKAPVP